MPVLGITTPIEFASSEWDKLARAWRNLTPTQRDLDLQRYLDAQREAGKLKLYPELPGWDEILKTGDATTGLTADQVKARKKRLIVKIQQSTTPLHQRAVANVINAIDDLQDLASFTGLIARLVLRAAPRVALRFVPGLGWIATASDVLNLLSFLTLTAGAALGIHAEGPLAGAAIAAGPLFVKAALKREMWTMLRRSRPRGARINATSEHLAKLFQKDYKLPRGTAQKYANLIGKRVGFSEIIEAGQAVETLTGYGLSLGAIMGYLSDFSWAAYRDVLQKPIRNVAPLVTAIQQAAPSEFILIDDQENVRAINFDTGLGLGPAFPLWKQKHPEHWPYEGDLQAIYAGKEERPAYCYMLKWIQHPRYPREPDSVTVWAPSIYPPSNPGVNGIRQRASEKDLILTVHATVNYG